MLSLQKMTDQSGDNISSNLLISSMLKEGSVLLNKQFKLTRSFNIVATSYQSKRLCHAGV